MTVSRRADGRPVIRVRRLDVGRVHEWFNRRGRAPMWTVYRPVTREYPGKWVARCWVTLPHVRPTRYVLTHDTVAELRTMLPHGLVKLMPNPGDPQEIYEIWV